MSDKKAVFLNESDLLRVEQIVLDHDKDDAFLFVRDVIKKAIDKEKASQMKRGGIWKENQKI
ncbi:MAG: hypothetical protein KKC39_02470 [Candidatus Omnitrophica bacterium]|nr:hypothetical protein [Candidatus Omnitrophota bacterium]MBU4419331.1 hypothetical protein [Candidatus Omnitrophota bacterium]MBU4467594.1 hypothetical protein [Candidatus Omnitrophota bacterium]MCG2708123.1 hypothetical protein [Candidatus Omnitrophota bacterium]